MAKGELPTRTQSSHALLIVDDERSLRFSIGEWARDSGYTAIEAAGGEQALEAVRDGAADAVLLDLKLGGEDGIEVLKRLRAEDDALPVIMLTGHGSIAHAVEATRLGAFDFMVKPPDLDHLGVVVARAIEHTRLRREVSGLRREKLPSLVGAGAGLQPTLSQLEKAARGPNTTVLLLGETGSGKGLLARWLHAKSPRADAPMVELNCSAIPEALLESELYGHEKGAFTDAKRFRKGLIEMADGGTLFLDEIGEMSPQLQAKLLHVLEHRTFRRVGGGNDISVDVRIVAATHRDLPREVSEGRFREDLFFRLSVVPVHVPPLREHPEDIEALVESFVANFCRELGRRPARVHPAALAALRAYSWPGNVRELRNVIERVVLLEAEDEIRPEHLPSQLAPGRATPGGSAAMFAPGVVRPLAEVELAAIQHALGVSGGNKTRAAAQLGISRQTLRTKLKEHAIADDVEEDSSAT